MTRPFTHPPDIDSLTPAQYLEKLIAQQSIGERLSAEILLTTAAIQDIVKGKLHALLEEVFWRLPDAELYMDIANHLCANRATVNSGSKLDEVKARLIAKYATKSA